MGVNQRKRSECLEYDHTHVTNYMSVLQNPVPSDKVVELAFPCSMAVYDVVT